MFQIAAKQASLTAPMDGPLKLHLIFYMPRMKKHDKKGSTLWADTELDWDKLSRAVSDSLTNAKVIKDDARICFAIVIKRHCQVHEVPGVLVRVSQLPREYSMVEYEGPPSPPN